MSVFKGQRRVSLKTRLSAAMVVAAVLPTVVVGTLAFRSASSALESSASAGLEAIRASRASSIEQFSDLIEEQIQDTSLHSEAVDAIELFEPAFDDAGAENLLELYGGSGGELGDAGDGSAWTDVHERFHPSFREFQTSYGYYDVFLFDTQGDLVYTVFKEPDFSTNFAEGPYADTGLGEAFRGALSGEVTWADYAAYAPSNGDPAAFVAAPVYSGDELRGVIAFQMPIDRISAVVQESTGLGDTGETYLVGSDHIMRTQSRFTSDNTIGVVEIATGVVDEALVGNSGVSRMLDYRGVDVLSAYQPIRVFGQHYAMLAEQDAVEVLAGTRALALQVTVISVIAAAVMGLLGMWFARTIANPVRRVSDASVRLARGETDIELGQGGGDELGELINSFSQTVGYLRELAGVAGSVAAGDLTVEYTPAGHDDTLGHALADMVASLRAVVGDVGSVASDIDGSAKHLTEASGESARASDEVAQSIVTVATAAGDQARIAERLVDAVRLINDEVDGTVGSAHRMVAASGTARTQAHDGSTLIRDAGNAIEEITAAFSNMEHSVSDLDGNFQRVGEIVDLIRSIAQQTNLLALNAAIEAARAGEAGRGFAVVATEVKALAEESAESTERIAQIVEKMKDGVGVAVRTAADARTELDRGTQVVLSAGDAFQSITDSVEDIERQAGEVSTATDRINVIAAEVRGNADELTGLTESNGAVAEEVAAASEETAATAAEVGTLAESLSSSSQRLTETLGRFKV